MIQILEESLTEEKYKYKDLVFEYHNTTSKGTMIYKVYNPEISSSIAGYKLSIYSNSKLRYPYVDDNSSKSIIEIRVCPWNQNVLSVDPLISMSVSEYNSNIDAIEDKVKEDCYQSYNKYIHNLQFKKEE